MEATRNRLVGVMSLIGIVLCIFGMPRILLQAGVQPIPSGMPDWENVRQSLTTLDDGRVVITVLGLLGWVAWAYITYLIVEQGIGMVRGVLEPVEGLSAPQRGARRVVAAAALLFVGIPTTASMASAAETQPTVAATSQMTLVPPPGVTLDAGASEAATKAYEAANAAKASSSAGAASTGAPSASSPGVGVPPSISYPTGVGGNTGSGNSGFGSGSQPGLGTTGSDQTGQSAAIPTTGSATPAATPSSAADTAGYSQAFGSSTGAATNSGDDSAQAKTTFHRYKIKKGDTLSEIAETKYGYAYKPLPQQGALKGKPTYMAIAHASVQEHPTIVKNPHFIRAGDYLNVPDDPTKVDEEQAANSTSRSQDSSDPDTNTHNNSKNQNSAPVPSTPSAPIVPKTPAVPPTSYQNAPPAATPTARTAVPTASTEPTVNPTPTDDSPSSTKKSTGSGSGKSSKAKSSPESKLVTLRELEYGDNPFVFTMLESHKKQLEKKYKMDLEDVINNLAESYDKYQVEEKKYYSARDAYLKEVSAETSYFESKQGDEYSKIINSNDLYMGDSDAARRSLATFMGAFEARVKAAKAFYVPLDSVTRDALIYMQKSKAAVKGADGQEMSNSIDNLVKARSEFKGNYKNVVLDRILARRDFMIREKLTDDKHASKNIRVIRVPVYLDHVTMSAIDRASNGTAGDWVKNAMRLIDDSAGEYLGGSQGDDARKGAYNKAASRFLDQLSGKMNESSNVIKAGESTRQKADQDSSMQKIGESLQNIEKLKGDYPTE